MTSTNILTENVACHPPVCMINRHRIHDLMSDHCTIQCITCLVTSPGDTQELLSMLEYLRVPEKSCVIQKWECGGSVFLDYLNIVKCSHQLSTSEDDLTEYDLESLYLGLKQLAARISKLPSNSPREMSVPYTDK